MTGRWEGTAMENEREGPGRKVCHFRKYLVDAARRLNSGRVLARDAANDGQRRCNQQEQRDDDQNGGEGHGSCRGVRHRNPVQREEAEGQRNCHEK